MEPVHASKVALVTGASRGIGQAVVRRLVAQGAKVLGVARDEKALGDLSDELNTNEKIFAWEAGDLKDAKLCGALPGKCLDHFGRLDIVVNNAGINTVAEIEKLSLEEWEKVIRINLTAPFLITKAALPILKRLGNGVIINVSSVSAKIGLPKFSGYAAYCASKYGLQGLTDVIFTEIRGSGVRVVAVQPGSTETDLLRASLPDAEADLEPNDVAEVISYLASEEARKINGATIEIFP